MKKYVILTLVLSAALLIFGFFSVSVPSAQALTTTLPDSGVVGNNLLSDPSFDNVSVRYTSALTAPLDSWSFSNATLNKTSEYFLVTTSSSWSGLGYAFTNSYSSLTVSFFVKSNVTLTFGLRAYTGSWSIVSDAYYSASDDYVLRSLTISNIPSNASRYFLYIWLNTPGDLYLKWSKMELGSSFTGYVPSNYTNYGYDQGYIDGLIDYSFHADDLAFNGVETQNYLSSGWSDLYGLTSITPLLSAQFSLTSRFYEQQGYSIESQGTIPITDSNNQVIGFAIWISPLLGLTALDYRSSTSYFEVALLQHSTYLSYTDPSFPSSWNPVTYPNAKSVTLFAEYGFTEYVQQLRESSYNLGVADGKISGYFDGFSEGEASGYNTGYSAGVELARNGTWFALFSAIINIPVSSLMSLLNYDFFGINMWDLARFLLTFILFFAVLHFFTKGKLRA